MTEAVILIHSMGRIQASPQLPNQNAQASQPKPENTPKLTINSPNHSQRKASEVLACNILITLA